MKGCEAGFGPCPHCGKESEYVELRGEAWVICSDHNCWGGMSAKWGMKDDKDAFVSKLRRNWNRRADTQNQGLKAALNSVIRYRNRVYEENQLPYSEYDQLTVDALDEVILTMMAYVE